MVEKIKIEHEKLRIQTTTHPDTTSQPKVLNEQQDLTLNGGNQNIENNSVINKTIGNMQKVIYSQNNIDEGITKQISILYLMIEDIKKKLVPLSTPTQSTIPSNEESKTSIEDIWSIKHELKTIKENAARDKVNNYEMLGNLSDIVQELKDKLIKVSAS